MIYKQSVFDTWPIENNTVQAIITSPPYFGLRKYNIPDVIIGGDKNCQHEFNVKEYLHPTRGNRGQAKDKKYTIRQESQPTNNKASLCIKCNAWQGQYGLETTLQKFVQHTRLWAKEAWRVLKNDGILFLNLGDTYGGFQGKGRSLKKGTGNSHQSKCQLLVPHRVVIDLLEDDWKLRNTIIWYKNNPMPESCKDRFSKTYEYIFMLVKSQNYYFNLDAVKMPVKQTSYIRARYDNNSAKAVDEKSYISNVNIKKWCNKLLRGEFLGKNPGDVWCFNTNKTKEKHYASWNPAMVKQMILCSTKIGDIVLDPFCGTGTTLKAAIQLHRKGIGIDLGYYEISKKVIATTEFPFFI